MWPVQLLERLAETQDSDERMIWADRLEAALLVLELHCL